jgi:Fe-S cluster assembly protein SufD
MGYPMEKIRIKGKQEVVVSGDASIEVADGAQAVIMIKPKGDARIEMKVGKGCRVDCFHVSEKAGKLSIRNSVKDRSVVRTCSLWLCGGEGKTENILEGKGAQSYDVHVFLGRGTERLSIDTALRQISKDTKGDMLVKGVVKDGASADVRGMVRIEKGATGAESFLSEHIMLLGKDARARADPKLEIEDNDVFSKHSASVSQIDEDKVFYLSSRGVDDAQARNLIVEGFLSSALDRMGDTARREALGKMLDSALGISESF